MVGSPPLSLRACLRARQWRRGVEQDKNGRRREREEMGPNLDVPILPHHSRAALVIITLSDTKERNREGRSLTVPRITTGPGNIACTWFGEFCSYCCLPLLPQLAFIILANFLAQPCTSNPEKEGLTSLSNCNFISVNKPNSRERKRGSMSALDGGLRSLATSYGRLALLALF